MATFTQASPLLALPLELRTKVYEQLLRPNSDRVYTLYHDRHGREASFDIDPTILRVNKQIYSEAVSILYDTASIRIYLATPVVKQCKGGKYPDRIVDPPDLFRRDIEGAVRPANRLDWCIAPSPVNDVEFEGQLNSTTQGCIYPHCFKRLRKVQLITSRHAIWGGSKGGSYFSHTGQTVLWILKLFAQEQVTTSPMTKRLKFAILPDWRTAGSHLLMKNGEIDEKTRTIIGLLEALKRRTNAEVEVEEGMFKEILKNCKMEEIEVDDWDKVLSADAETGL